MDSLSFILYKRSNDKYYGNLMLVKVKLWRIIGTYDENYVTGK